jgi:hypothetical protein
MRSMVAPSASKVTASSAATAADSRKAASTAAGAEITEAEKIEITRRTMRIVEPRRHHHDALRTKR